MMWALELPAIWRNNSVKKLILFVVIYFSQMVWAAENALPVQDLDEAANEDTVEQTETDQDSEPERASEEEAFTFVDVEDTDEGVEESPSRFIPTEQISQDFGVSFPVDI